MDFILTMRFWGMWRIRMWSGGRWEKKWEKPYSSIWSWWWRLMCWGPKNRKRENWLGRRSHLWGRMAGVCPIARGLLAVKILKDWWKGRAWFWKALRMRELSTCFNKSERPRKTKILSSKINAATMKWVRAAVTVRAKMMTCQNETIRGCSIASRTKSLKTSTSVSCCRQKGPRPMVKTTIMKCKTTKSKYQECRQREWARTWFSRRARTRRIQRRILCWVWWKRRRDRIQQRWWTLVLGFVLLLKKKLPKRATWQRRRWTFLRHRLTAGRRCGGTIQAR